IALALRDLRGPVKELDDPASFLARRGDADNALFARLVHARRLALLGDVDGADAALRKLSLTGAPARLVALASLAAADLAMKRIDAESAARWIAEGRRAAVVSRIPGLVAEIERLARQLNAPVARLSREGQSTPVRLHELPALFTSDDFLVDACRREARVGPRVAKLVTRPVLFELLLALAEAAPGEAARDTLIARVFGARRVNDSHRVRLRVEIGRLRKLLVGLAHLQATPYGFALAPRETKSVAILLPPTDGEASALLALFQGGEAWATSALAAAVGKSQRAVQRALGSLEKQGKVRATGEGRARRWVASPAAGFATTLLLVAPGTLG
ncbi:MAG TPA: helix-turn-helix domain-containing protein, partial [Polyangiaceae bacterium]